MAARLWSKAETDAEQAEPRYHRSRTHGQQRQDEASPSEEQRAKIEKDEELKQLEKAKSQAEEALARGCEEHGCAALAIRTVLASSDLPDTLRQLAVLVYYMTRVCLQNLHHPTGGISSLPPLPPGSITVSADVAASGSICYHASLCYSVSLLVLFHPGLQP
ncbi:hypothetical protein V8E36_008442 [Tilletia maclaganii]